MVFPVEARKVAAGPWWVTLTRRTDLDAVLDEAEFP